MKAGDFYENFPDNIETPNYGDKWGRSANYIEIIIAQSLKCMAIEQKTAY